MSRWQRPVRAGGAGARTHHIDAIAHHFLGYDDEAAAAPRARRVLDVAVAAPGAGRAAACTAAGLAAAAARAGLGSCLVEDESVAWSSYSFLSGDEPAAAPALLTSDLPPGVRARAWAQEGRRPDVWMRWRLLGEASPAALPAWETACGLPAAARAAAPQWTALVWCAGAAEAVEPASLSCLGRLVELLDPERLEFLVVPDAWDARPGGWRLLGRRSDPGWRNLAHLQDAARGAAGGRPSGVRVFPDAPAVGPEAAAILAETVAVCAGRLAAGAAG